MQTDWRPRWSQMKGHNGNSWNQGPKYRMASSTPLAMLTSHWHIDQTFRLVCMNDKILVVWVIRGCILVYSILVLDKLYFDMPREVDEVDFVVTRCYEVWRSGCYTRRTELHLEFTSPRRQHYRQVTEAKRSRHARQMPVDSIAWKSFCSGMNKSNGMKSSCLSSAWLSSCSTWTSRNYVDLTVALNFQIEYSTLDTMCYAWPWVRGKHSLLGQGFEDTS